MTLLHWEMFIIKIIVYTMIPTLCSATVSPNSVRCPLIPYITPRLSTACQVAARGQTELLNCQCLETCNRCTHKDTWKIIIFKNNNNNMIWQTWSEDFLINTSSIVEHKTMDLLPVKNKIISNILNSIIHQILVLTWIKPIKNYMNLHK